MFMKYSDLDLSNYFFLRYMPVTSGRFDLIWFSGFTIKTREQTREKLKRYFLLFNAKWSFYIYIYIYIYISTKSCKLCLLEKSTILNNSDDKDSLNMRGDLMSKCRHRSKYLLSAVTWCCFKISFLNVALKAIFIPLETF